MKLKEIKTYCINGKLSQHYFIDYKKRKQGKYINYFYDGITKMYEINYKNDMWNGRYIDYYSTGLISSIKYYCNGRSMSEKEYLKYKIERVIAC